HGALEFAKDLWDVDEPSLWQKDLTGQLIQWIDLGQPDDKRVMKSVPRAERVAVYSYTSSTPIWWSGIATKITRATNLTVWQIPAEQSQALAKLAQRTMQLQVTVQDGAVWVGDGAQSIEITPQRLYGNE
ncbi:MAG TPA: YaeQ family protein, partial [Rhizobacter sp.]